MSDAPISGGTEPTLEMYRTIGEFIYSFSQLELTIRYRLGKALKLEAEMADIVVGPFDFATLCNVTREVLRRTNPEIDSAFIKKLFDRCLTLNQKARVVVAHGTWFHGGGASHFSKSSLKLSTHFEDLGELQKYIQEAHHLMTHVVASTGWGLSTFDFKPAPL